MNEINNKISIDETNNNEMNNSEINNVEPANTTPSKDETSDSTVESSEFKKETSDFNQEDDVNIKDFQESLTDYTTNEVPSFVRLSDKYKDITSSAFTMLLVGGVGFTLLLLVIFDVISLPISSSTSWLFDSVMGGVFIIFIIAGIVSFMHAKQVKIDAKKEDALIEELLEWADENIKKDDLDQGLDLNDPEELLYFNRYDKIKDMLMRNFENADESLICEYSEQIYNKIYE